MRHIIEISELTLGFAKRYLELREKVRLLASDKDVHALIEINKLVDDAAFLLAGLFAKDIVKAKKPDGYKIENHQIELKADDYLTVDLYYSADFTRDDRTVGYVGGWDVQVEHVIWRGLDIYSQLTSNELERANEYAWIIHMKRLDQEMKNGD